MIRIRFKKQSGKTLRYAEAMTYDDSTSTSQSSEGRSVGYSEAPEMRLLKRKEVEKIVKELRQQLLGLGFRARVQVKGSGLILTYLRLKEAKPYTEPYQNSDYRVRDEFGVVWIDDMRNREAKTKKARKLNFLQYGDWQKFQNNLRELFFANKLVGTYKRGSKRLYPI